MDKTVGHEKLYVYQQGLEYISWSHPIISKIENTAAVLDHWNRSSESIVENIANGNSRRSRSDRNRYFNVAVGSALECAACLDICDRRSFISGAQVDAGKAMLQSIVRMTIKLRDSKSGYIKEKRNQYETGNGPVLYFAHEELDVYKTALEMIVWFADFSNTKTIASNYAKRLDKSTTSLVLNIAEGNGRFSEAEQIRFLDIANNCAVRTNVCLDILSTRFGIQVDEGKRILGRMIPLIFGLRNSLED